MAKKRGRPKKETGITLGEQKPVAVIEPDVPAIADANALIARAIDKGLPVESMERLLAMRRELRAEWAREQYFKALAIFQQRCPEIKKTKGVKNDDGTIRYRYAPLESIVAQVKNLLEECGFSYVLKPKQTVTEFVAVCVAHHKDGHEEVTEFAVPLGAEKYMTEVQKVGARNTFAKRYAFCNAFGIMTGEDDTDALDGSEKPAKRREQQVIDVTPRPAPVDTRTEAEVAHDKLLMLYKQMVGLKLYTPEELDGKIKQAQVAMDKKDLNSLTDLYNAWSIETKERQKK